MTESSKSPGWDAITTALEGLYPGQEPKHFGTAISYAMGGPDPIDGISIFEATEPKPHWHFVTYGFSELHEKENDNPDFSGFGFELTLRLERGDEKEPPMFAMGLLQNLARYVFQTGNVFNTGDHMDLNGPMEVASSTDITAICFAEDSELGSIDTPNGALEFRQVVGITADELAAIKAWNTDGFLDIFRRFSPLLLIDLSRSSLLSDPAIDGETREGSLRDGSSTGGLFVRQMKIGKAGRAYDWTIGAYELETVARVLPARLGHQNSLSISDGEKTAEFVPGETPSVRLKGEQLIVTLTPEATEAMVKTLEAKRGTYTWPEIPGFQVTVEPTDIRDSDGKVLRTVG